jgi:DNA-damage-inducible protein J
LTYKIIYVIIISRKKDDYIMANMTSAININVDTKIKNEATAILKGLGLNMSTFINMALTQVVKRNGVPFEITNPKPSKDMLEAFAEINEMINNPDKYPRYNNREDLKKSLLSDE